MSAAQRRPAAAAALALAAALGACSDARDGAARDARPVVVVSVVPQAWFVERLVDDAARVVSMLPPGASPALYEPTLAQMEAVSHAVLYVAVGHPRFAFERAWLDRIRSANPAMDVLPLAADEPPDSDPHVWLAPGAAHGQARRIAAALAEHLPAERDAIGRRLAALEAEIDTVEEDLHRVLDPHRGERFWVFHPAWGRLAAEYGLEQVAIEHEGKEPDTRALAALIERARAAGVRVVFVQPQLSAASARVVADAVGARVETLDPLAPDWAANLRRAGAKIAAGAVP